MKRLTILFLTLLLATGLIACSAGVSKSMPSPGSGGGIVENYAKDGRGEGAMAPDEKTTGNNASSSQAEVEITRKIVRNASLDLEVTDVVSAYDSLLGWAESNGGYEIERNQQKSGNVTYINAKIKIKPDLLDELLEFAKTLGEPINTQITTENITESYYDTKTRLEAMELALETYYGFLKKAQTIEESLEVQREINQQTTEIEALKGRLKVWDSLLAESILTLRMRQTDDPVKLKKDIDWSALSLSDMGYLIKNGLIKMTSILVGVFQWLAIVLAVSAPVWLVLLIVFLVIWRRRKKKKAEKTGLNPAELQQKNRLDE